MEGKYGMRTSSSCNSSSSMQSKEGVVYVKRKCKNHCREYTFHIRYKIFRPSYLTLNCSSTCTENNTQNDCNASNSNRNQNEPSNKVMNNIRSPVIVLHGGPSIPSDYLYPIVHMLPKNRAVIFYDQLGCGRSDEPRNIEFYSIDLFVSDLACVIQTLHLQSFHIYAHSFGGILAYEYWKKRVALNSDARLVSIVIASTPTSVSLAQMESDRLHQEIKNECVTSSLDEVANVFHQRHQCRTNGIPKALSEALHKVGHIFVGMDSIGGYVAHRIEENGNRNNMGNGDPRVMEVLIVRGEYDFITQHCIQDWSNLFEMPSKNVHTTMKTISNTSHYGHLEDNERYTEILEEFYTRQHDP